MSRLPPEIFTQILLQLVVSRDLFSLIRVLQCCKAWQIAGSRLLYRDIVLTNERLSRFTRRFNDHHSHLVRSLTISIDPFEQAQDNTGQPLGDIIQTRMNGGNHSRGLWQVMEQLSKQIKGMRNISVLAFRITIKSSCRGFWIPSPIITTLLHSLPESCTSLEIDTRGFDSNIPGTAHVCNEIRKILPRLRHLRLCLFAMCPSLFGEGLIAGEREINFSAFKPTPAPLLETLFINCIPQTSRYPRSNICYTFKENLRFRGDRLDLEARTALNEALCLARDALCYPIAKKMSVFYNIVSKTNPVKNPPVYRCLIRSDLSEMAAWVMPYAQIGRRALSNDYLIRLPGDKEIVGTSMVLEAVAEGEEWTETESGIRIPTSLYDRSFASFPTKTLRFFNTEEWRSANPTETCRLWDNEKTSGVRLLRAERRDDLFDSKPVLEKNPAGFTRERRGWLHALTQ